MIDPQFECPVLPQIFVDVRVGSVCGPGGVRNSARKRLRLSQASTVVAPPESVVDALERDLSHPSHEADDRCEDISVDVRDCTGVAVVQRAVDAQSHQCARVAEFAEAQTRRPVNGWCLWRLSMITGRSQIRTQTALCLLGKMMMRTQPKRTIVLSHNHEDPPVSTSPPRGPSFSSQSTNLVLECEFNV